MLSGNGRHRRPRQAPALLVAAGVTGSAIAIPLFAASGASAADGSTWDKVAQCETGGSWSENNGDGFYGGLKLTQENWEKYGGLDYAPSADLASRNQQIAVAEKLLDDQGVGAFHTCGLTTGLTKDSGSADVDTGVADDSSGSSGNSDSSDSSDSTGLSNSSGDTGSGSSSSGDGSDSSASPSASVGSADNSANSAKSGNSSSPSASPSKSQETDSSSTGRANGDDSDNSEQAVGSWSLVDTGAIGSGRHRGAAAEEGAGEDADAGRTSDTYTVHSGDTLASIADSLDLDGGWRALYDANKQDIGTDPNRIAAGQTLDLPAE
ncbi:LysM peptidoglycan-binding domain-containing protein [Streptomyces cylindrosporus]|uniref:LysM peptidoglycan-binding domain-containing protein n=1 Tax=Streptomyces cylindrosporus TaxID=2927583 RepID=A0ABS9Y5S9_9ACTN|nr:transglycosylase family protein [Streptomyces cylindrosporus]MCI3272568.1 LysM peptidoglycan-binding domain-containing protein [Streptomyces cylindrosporus]